MKSFIYLFLCCLLPALSSNAQTVYKDQVRIENTSVTRSDDNRLTIAFDLFLQANLKLTSNRAATITPLLETTGNIKALPAVVVYGRRRSLVNERNSNVPQNAYTIVRRKAKTEQKVSYLVQMPYEAWMQRASLTLNTDLCGCCDIVEEGVADLIYKLNIEPAKPQPYIAYITPKAEPVKHRAAVGRAYLDYPVNQTVIRPEYRNNSIELAKIRATIDTIRNDRNTSITHIAIEGFASPEGSYVANARLAEGRTASLIQYVRNYYQLDNKVLKMISTPEDWVGFRNFVETSQMDKKNEILLIIDNTSLDYDVREKQIAKLIGPDAYRFLLNECYPALRRADYTVNYTVRGFNSEEAKEIIFKRPQQLSLQEIFNVAQSYDKGSEEFNHAFQVAVLMFPDDPTANLNAAAMEIQKGGDLTLAKKYLAKADPTAVATLNNLGVVAMLEGKLSEAETYFLKAKESGIDEAESNLKEVSKQRNYPTE